MQKLEEVLTLNTDDPTAASRKKDHIQLAFQSQVKSGELDKRFYYEPILSGHPQKGSYPKLTFLDKTLNAPIWVSSMTGGTEMAYTINQNLARVCGEFGMGMGLGSCRSLLHSNERIKDFDVRFLMGDDLPLYANLGIAQVEQLVVQKESWRILELLKKLDADGLIIHVNPLQEWLQPEGDFIRYSPLQTIEQILEQLDIKVIVKEVGQGMGYKSIKALLQLPLEAIDFAASGGTNFAKLELLRSTPSQQFIFENIARLGHTAEEMVEFTNKAVQELGNKVQCQQIIISGGVRNFLDGYYLMKKSKLTSIYGQASGFLKHAQGNYDKLQAYVAAQVSGLELSNAFLRIKEI